jgi:ESS family glutamate:Na+ symporter
MITIEINKYLTLAIAVGVLMLGQFLRKRIRFLETFCIPAPVVGGLVVAIISCIL